jgi:hypothetical protein
LPEYVRRHGRHKSGHEYKNSLKVIRHHLIHLRPQYHPMVLSLAFTWLSASWHLVSASVASRVSGKRQGSAKLPRLGIAILRTLLVSDATRWNNVDETHKWRSCSMVYFLDTQAGSYPITQSHFEEDNTHKHLTHSIFDATTQIIPQRLITMDR